MSVALADREHKERGPGCTPDRVESVVGHQLSKSITHHRPARQPHIGHPDASHRRPKASPGEHLFAAQFAQLEKVATELVADWWIAQYERSAAIHEQWGQRYAELNDPAQARECHSIAVALRQRCELIRIWPEDFTDTLAVLADVFADKQVNR